MMKSMARLSVGIALAALLAFAPCAFGQSTVNVNAASHSVLSHAVPGFLTVVFGGRDGWGGGGDGKGCGNNGGNGWDGGGKDGRGGRDGGGKCQAVNEGGTNLMYVLLAGVACLGAMFLRSRRVDSQNGLAEASQPKQS
jgi:hypothetical protein